MKSRISLKVLCSVIAATISVTALVSAETPKRPVEAELKAMSDGVAEKAPEAAKIFAEGIAAVAESGLVEHALTVGDKVPLFELPDASGKTVKLKQLLANGPVVLTWYRGGWCPYCNIGLKGLLKEQEHIEQLGATIVAISPETPDSMSETVKANSLSLIALSDKGNGTARKFKIAYEVPEKSLTMMKAFKVDLEKQNGDQSGELPLGATYIIDKSGTIRWSFVDADYRKRAEPSDIVAALKKLKRK